MSIYIQLKHQSSMKIGGEKMLGFFFFKSFSRKQTEQELQQNKEIDKNRETQNPRGIEQSTTERQAGDAQGFTK